MKVKIFRIRSRYWIPTRDRYRIVKKLLRIAKKFEHKNTIIFISEKALLTSLGFIYDESLIKISKIDLLNVKIFKYVWCSLFRRLFREYIYESLCNVRDIDLARHLHLCSSISRNLLSILKPVSTCGVDTSLLPYFYVTYPSRDNYAIIKKVIDEIYHRCRLLSICVVDSDLSIIIKKFNIVLVSRPVHVPGCINLGVLTYVLAKCFKSYKLFIKCPTITYFRGHRSLIPYRIFYIARRISKYLKSPVRTVLETARYVGAIDYTLVKWCQVMKIFPHYPVVIVRFLYE